VCRKSGLPREALAWADWKALHVVCGILEIRNDGPAARLEDPENLPASVVAALTAPDIVNA